MALWPYETLPLDCLISSSHADGSTGSFPIVPVQVTVSDSINESYDLTQTPSRVPLCSPIRTK